MNQKIENPKTQIAQTPQMNDRDFLNDQLTYEKYLTAGYSVFLNEASHQRLYQDVLTIANETQNCQRRLFNLMFQKGWYSFDAASAQEIQQEVQTYQGYQSQFPYGGFQ